MKKIMKKCCIFAVSTAMLLASVLLITACMEPAGSPGSPPPPEGMGYLMLNIDDSYRTVMPAASNITYYSVNITGGANNPGISYYTPSSLSSAIFTVVVGSQYTVSIVGYTEHTDIGDSGIIQAATGTAATATIVASTNNVTVPLIGVTDGNDEGTFFWSFGASLPSTTTLASATFNLSIISGGNDSEITAFNSAHGDLAANLTNPLGGYTLSSGIYEAVITLTPTDTRYDERVLKDRIEIYPGHASSWNYGAIAALNRNAYTITFDDGGNSNATGMPSPTNISSGSTVSVPIPPTDSTSAFNFDGWFTDNPPTIPFNFVTAITPDRMTSDITLYAKWVSSSANLTVNIDFPTDLGGSSYLTLAAPAATRSGLLGGADVKFTLTDPTGELNWTAARWTSGSFSQTANPIGNESSITLTGTHAAPGSWFVHGTHDFTIYVTIDGKEYTRTFQYTLPWN